MFFKNKGQQSATAGVVGLYGKHPSAGDFLRINAATPEVRQLDEWLSAAMEAGPRLLPTWDADFPSVSRLSFLFHNPDDSASTSALLGVMTASRDTGGRKFPLILFTYLDMAAAANGYAYVAQEAFLVAATELLMQQPNMSRDELFARAQQLRAPDAQSLARAQQAQQAYLAGTNWIPAFSTMFGLAALVQQGKALGTMRSVLGSLGGGPFPRYGIRCPLGMDAAGNSGLWLGLVNAALGNRVVPIMFWSPRSLLVYFRRASNKSLAALLDPEWQDDNICDLSTAKTGDEQANLPGPDQPLAALL